MSNHSLEMIKRIPNIQDIALERFSSQNPFTLTPRVAEILGGKHEA